MENSWSFHFFINAELIFDVNSFLRHVVYAFLTWEMALMPLVSRIL